MYGSSAIGGTVNIITRIPRENSYDLSLTSQLINWQALQSEERTHYVLMGGADYQINFNQDNSSFIAYLAGQQTTRKHYTGIVPDDPDDILAYMLDPPYGYTYNTTLRAGTQFNHRLTDFLGGQNVVTLGAEYVYDNVLDTIPAYN